MSFLFIPTLKKCAKQSQQMQVYFQVGGILNENESISTFSPGHLSEVKETRTLRSEDK